MSVLAWMSTSWRLRLGVLGAMLPVMLAAVLALPSSVLLGLQVLSACLALVWLEAQVSRPLARIRQDAEQVACGETAASDSLHRVDDIGMLARSIKQAGLNLKSLLDDVSHQVGGVRTASSEIAQGNADLSARTEQSAASLQETAASMAQMNATVAGNAQRPVRSKSSPARPSRRLMQAQRSLISSRRPWGTCSEAASVSQTSRP